MVRVFAFILKVKGSNFTNGVFVINNGKLIVFLKLIPYNRLITWPTYLY
jgi:hypothetical protein